ncbi:uncharacterized protein ARMOST_21621 [Armillaria ostoyae]|uniref:Uncharacterized protein n=1 Tax=Armillaria ostoyae TaxID=47428 RepID=A0A284SAK9_ARMOS|nr:uncharacterized protein ARMOST_21621 [Armillaria ostoyae]
MDLSMVMAGYEIKSARIANCNQYSPAILSETATSEETLLESMNKWTTTRDGDQSLFTTVHVPISRVPVNYGRTQ